MTEQQIKADAISEFVNTMIGALESGFIDSNTCTLAQVHQVAKHHIKDNYGIDTPNIVEQWGKEVAELCGLGQSGAGDQVIVPKDKLTQLLNLQEDGEYYHRCELANEIEALVNQ